MEDPEGLIRIRESDLEILMSNLERDTQFLQDLDIMDYSLLLVVEHLKKPLPFSVRKPQFQNQNTSRLSDRTDIQKKGRALGSGTSSKTVRKQMFNEYGRNVFLSEDRTMIYHIGIIDYLQEWNFSKKLERSIKVHILKRKGKLISAVEPTFYRTRFLDYMRTIFKYNQEKNKYKTLMQEFERLEQNYTQHGLNDWKIKIKYNNWGIWL